LRILFRKDLLVNISLKSLDIGCDLCTPLFFPCIMSEAVAAVVATATATPAAEEPKVKEPKVEEPKAVVKAEAPANADEIVQQVEVSTLPFPRARSPAHFVLLPSAILVALASHS
jgi:hypothetical protein